jgi:uncharacterized protein (TIGR03643 family)
MDLATRGGYPQTDGRIMTSASKAPLSDETTSRIIEMAWEDRTPFDAIRASFGVSEPEVIALMRANLKRASFKLWRERVSGRRTKHASRSDPKALRHRATHRWQGG